MSLGARRARVDARGAIVRCGRRHARGDDDARGGGGARRQRGDASGRAAAAAAAVEGRETGAGGDERGERWGRCGRDFELVRKRVRDGGRCARGARAKGRDVPEDDVAVRVGHVGDFVGVQGAVHRVADG